MGNSGWGVVTQASTGRWDQGELSLLREVWSVATSLHAACRGLSGKEMSLEAAVKESGLGR